VFIYFQILDLNGSNGKEVFEMADYGISIKLGISYEQAVKAVTEALKSEGFGVLTEIDVKATLKKKLDVNFREYVILGACNPPLAHKALSTELEIGLLLPCNVIVYEEEGGAVVAAIDPIAAMGVVGNQELESIAQQVNARLRRVIDSLRDR
jgi:uncharacterized protein (DUF302 family)